MMSNVSEIPLVSVLNDLALEALSFSDGKGGCPFEVGISEKRGQTCAFIKAPSISPRKYLNNKTDCSAPENKDLACCKSGLTIAKKILRSYGQHLFVEESTDGSTLYWVELN